ncbi:endosulfine-domain-containing protein [Phanerochaete sordida]|uniref:mRNA stability protein n=1 Tax=Phanerochaete sordida TaxID=48140 RepID=A0A9P3LE10_9APHY|nr:endosulfine-domain-containing protein [Phanerochaete sordida]
MLPAQRNKVDISNLSEEEKKLFRLYGKLPTHKNVLNKMQKDRKYFDSGDYALSKAGKAPQNTVGTTIPSPENIPHANSPPVSHTLSSSPTNNSATSPIKESPLADPDRAAFQEAEPALAAEGAATETSAMPVEAEAEDKAE